MAIGISPFSGGSPGSPATSLGLGGLGDQLANQVEGETDEERKRRLRMQSLGLGGDRFGAGTGAGSVFGSTAASQLFGSYGR